MKPKRRRRLGQRSADELISAVLGEHGLVDEVREQRIANEWGQIVGKRVARRAWPERVAGGVLHLRVSSSAWLQELGFLTDDLIAKINRHLGGPALIAEIRLNLDSRPRAVIDRVARARTKQARPRLVRRPLPAPATGAELATIAAETAERVDDPELRAVIVDARRRLRN